jgi:endoglucanase
MPSVRIPLVSLLLFTGFATGADEPAPADVPAFAAAKALGRGVNLGNALDAPNEGAWGVTIKPGYLPRIKAAGFDHVRLPVKWSGHAGKTAPYTIDPKFAARVDEILDQAEKVGLRVVLNVHHYDEIVSDPAAHTERLLALWRQIARQYRDRPETVLFEALNEPHDKLTPALWNDLFPKALAVIRETNPTRPVVVGPGEWNGFRELKSLKLPADDHRLVATFHYYEPFEFTHQGADFQKGADKWLGRKWTGTTAEKKAVSDAFEQAAKWARDNRRPMYLGEFGAYEKADMTSRVTWTRFVRSEAERLGMPWAYWEFASGFGCYDPKTDEWREPLLNALIPNAR